jgi:anti-anti-sigma regulatory factor/DNA-directed RNA polymerase subunit RPC12/RpoP
VNAVRLGRLDAELSAGRVVLRGRIDDSSPLGELATQVAPGNVSIDTNGVTFINSIGMREWLRFVRALKARGRVTFERVAAVLITQMNLLPEFDGTPITSFHAQYVCEACGAEAVLLVDAIAHAEELRGMRAPKLPCPECGKPMDLADFPERYLSVFKA